MDNRDSNGVAVKELVEGNVAATVWVNKPRNGELFVKVTFRRLQEMADGRMAYRTSFFPQDLADLYRVIVKTVSWLREAGGLLFHGGNGKPDSSKEEPAGS